MATVDYFSNFWEIGLLENTKLSTVIKKLNSYFVRYGSPCVIVSDNGPQFTSANFENFSRNFDFEHWASSPYNSKSNGKAESAVMTAKALLRKNKEGDQFLALLNYRNTQSPATGTSPARFLNRRTQTLLRIPPKSSGNPVSVYNWRKKNFDWTRRSRRKTLISTQRISFPLRKVIQWDWSH